jgi:hypothetical protein
VHDRLVVDGLRDDDLLKQHLQQIQPADRGQSDERAGIGDHQFRQKFSLSAIH